MRTAVVRGRDVPALAGSSAAQRAWVQRGIKLLNAANAGRHPLFTGELFGGCFALFKQRLWYKRHSIETPQT